MIYLIGKVIAWMLLAFVLGAWLGWLLRNIRARETESRLGGDLQRSREQIATLNTDVGNARGEVAQSRTQLTELQEAMDTKETQLVELQAEHDEVIRQRDIAQERLGDCETENTQLSGELELQRGEQQKLLMQTTELEASLEERERVLEALDISARESADQLAIANKDHLALSAAKGEFERQVQELEGSLLAAQQGQAQQDRGNAELSAKVAGLEEQREKLRASTSENERKLSDVQKSRDQLESKVALLLGDLDSLKSVQEQDNERLQAQLEKQRSAVQEAQAQAGDNEGALRERTQELGLLQTAYDGQQSQVERLSTDVRRWRRRIPDLQAELDEKDMELQSLVGRLQSQKLQLQARRPIANDGRLSAAQLQARVARLQAQVVVTEQARQRAEGVVRDSHRLSNSQLQARVARLQAQLAGLTAKPNVVQPALDTVAIRAPESASQPGQPGAEPTTNQDSSIFMSSAPAQVDDLQRIKGIGPKLEELLNSLGLYQFAQIARLQAADITWLDERLNFKGRIERDAWIDQARGLDAQG